VVIFIFSVKVKIITLFTTRRMSKSEDARKLVMLTSHEKRILTAIIQDYQAREVFKKDKLCAAFWIRYGHYPTAEEQNIIIK
jgi:hypothetical protein